MKLKNITYFVCALLLLSCSDNVLKEIHREQTGNEEPGQSQQNTILAMNGTTYEERAQSLIDRMLETDLSAMKNGNLKYTAPFYFARLYSHRETDNAITQLAAMYQSALVTATLESTLKHSSNMEFYAHATLHGYMLTKEQLPDHLRDLIKTFLQADTYIDGEGSSINIQMMRWAVGLLCSEEWEDFKDRGNNTASDIKAYTRTKVLETLRFFFTKNCPEADAFTYLGVDLQYVRMLAEFCRDEEVRKTAESVYQHMIAQMLLPYNRGIYAACPSRNKGWTNLYTGSMSTDVQVVQLAWLFYGGQEERIIAPAANTDNFGCFNFWMAYRRNVKPVSYLEEMNANKTYPYDFFTVRADETRYGLLANGKQYYEGRWYSRYTYQSQNYGLSTQTIEGYPDCIAKKNFQYSYAYKETKNVHLVWQSADAAEACTFSVCLDNPSSPTKNATAHNAAGYGENPFHRVFGHGRSAIGIYNVDANYMNTPDFYQMYVPFSRTGIKRRMVRDINGMQWILCHTGTMMFAFATPEESDFMTRPRKGTYDIDGHYILTLKDTERRRGSWVLETTELTPYQAGGDMEAELNNFRKAIEERTKFERAADYETSATPSISYTNLAGDRLELKFFHPNQAYKDEYKVNGQAQKLNLTNISQSDYINQTMESGVVQFTNGQTLQLQ